MLTDNDLVSELPHPIAGVQRIYRWGNWGLSLINSPAAHDYPFAWEAAVLVWDQYEDRAIDYSTELTSDVEVFLDDDTANAFIDRARALFAGKEDFDKAKVEHSFHERQLAIDRYISAGSRE